MRSRGARFHVQQRGDPLQPHLDRLGAMPVSWRAHPVATPADHHAASRTLLLAHPAPFPTVPVEDPNEGFVHILAGGFDGILHWRGQRGEALHCHAPGRSAALLDAPLAIDLPGHGLSDDWTGSTDWRDWAAVIDAAAQALGATSIIHEALPAGDPAALFPDLAPDRFGAYLATAWQIVRAAILFDPWYEASAAHARAFDPAALAPDRLAAAHRALLQARAARALAIARQRQKGDT